MNELIKLVSDIDPFKSSFPQVKRSPHNPDDARSRAARKHPNKQSPAEYKKSYHKQYAYNEFRPFEYAD